MLSIGKLGPGQAEYYLDQADGPVSAVTGVSSGVEDYYVKGTEPPGQWCGRAAAALELSGQVSRASCGLSSQDDGRTGRSCESGDRSPGSTSRSRRRRA